MRIQIKIKGFLEEPPTKYVKCWWVEVQHSQKLVFLRKIFSLSKIKLQFYKSLNKKILF